MRTYRLPLSCYWFSHSNAHRSLFHAHGVQILTQEDAWAVRLLDTIACLRQLLKTGLTRDVYVFGNMQVPPMPVPGLCQSAFLPASFHNAMLMRNVVWGPEKVQPLHAGAVGEGHCGPAGAG